MPNIQFVNMSDLPFGNQQKVKKKKTKEKKKEEPVLDIRKIPAPHKIKASLDDYVVGQDYAEKSDVSSCLQSLQTCGSRC